MNSKNRHQKTWRTSDGSPWWLRSKRYSEPNGDYHANCYLHVGSAAKENSITFDDHSCNWHSKSYYCQPAKLNLKPAGGSPASCKCSKVSLTGKYSAGMLVKCSECRDVEESLLELLVKWLKSMHVENQVFLHGDVSMIVDLSTNFNSDRFFSIVSMCCEWIGFPLVSHVVK